MFAKIDVLATPLSSAIFNVDYQRDFGPNKQQVLSTDLTYDVIRMMVHDFLAVRALNVICRCSRNTSSEAELHGERVGEGFMSLC